MGHNDMMRAMHKEEEFGFPFVVQPNPNPKPQAPDQQETLKQLMAVEATLDKNIAAMRNS